MKRHATLSKIHVRDTALIYRSINKYHGTVKDQQCIDEPDRAPLNDLLTSSTMSRPEIFTNAAVSSGLMVLLANIGERSPPASSSILGRARSSCRLASSTMSPARCRLRHTVGNAQGVWGRRSKPGKNEQNIVRNRLELVTSAIQPRLNHAANAEVTHVRMPRDRDRDLVPSRCRSLAVTTTLCLTWRRLRLR